MRRTFIALVYLGLVLIATMSCKRCYQCVVRDSDKSDSIQWFYKEVCVSKKDFDAYKEICEEDSETSSTNTLYCECGENLEL